MKKFLLSIAFLFSLPAFAQTITFTELPLYCGAYRVCNSVQNDAGSEVALSATYTVYGPNPLTITVDGVTYTAQVPGFDVDVYSPEGLVAHVTAAFHSTSVRINSGRAHYTRTSWYLDSGSFTPY